MVTSSVTNDNIRFSTVKLGHKTCPAPRLIRKRSTVGLYYYSGAQGAKSATKESTTLIQPCTSFFMVKMASGMTHRHVQWWRRQWRCPGNKVVSLKHGNHAPKYFDLRLTFTSLILDIHVMSIENCWNKVLSEQYHMTTAVLGLGVELMKV